VTHRATIESYENSGLLTRERLGYSLTVAARRWPEREFVLFEGQLLTYRDVDRWTMGVAADLVARGVGPGDRILIQAPNRPEVAVLQLAAWRIGAVAVPVVPVYRQHELRHILADSKPRILATVSRHSGRRLCVELDEIAAEGGLEPLVKYALDPEHDVAGWTQLPRGPSGQVEPGEAALPAPAEPGTCHLILYTSGTTAAPKGAMLTGAGILSNCASIAKTLGLTERDVFVAGSPIAHVAGMSMGVILPMSLGARTIMLPAWNADAAVDLIEREGATFMSSAPVFLNDLVERYEAGAGASHRLSIYMAGGAATPPSLIRRADAVGIRASRIYGMTETAGACAMARPDDPLELRSQTDGRVVYGTEVQIVGDDGHAVPSGEIGEVRLRSPQLMIAYTDPAATARQIDEDGWFYPGDVGRIDDSGWFTMTGRTKDIINRGGEKFSSQDIEQALASHPDVAVAAVLGAPDQRFGEIVAAVIQLRPGVAWHGPTGLLGHLEGQKLAKQKMPVRWYVVDEIPTTAMGKIRKQKLLEMVIDQTLAAV
jgi:acyl-CoA synthetase (AMP-forming)/AMP-acid ligase II